MSRTGLVMMSQKHCHQHLEHGKVPTFFWGNMVARGLKQKGFKPSVLYDALNSMGDWCGSFRNRRREKQAADTNGKPLYVETGNPAERSYVSAMVKNILVDRAFNG